MRKKVLINNEFIFEQLGDSKINQQNRFVTKRRLISAPVAKVKPTSFFAKKWSKKDNDFFFICQFLAFFSLLLGVFLIVISFYI